MNGRRALATYRAIYAACIIALSVRTASGATGLSDHHFWLAGIEIVGALLLVWRRAQRIGLAVLLVVYAIAAGHDLLTGGIPIALVLFGASAAAIVQLDRGLAGEPQTLALPDRPPGG
jgi:hypothetical protein